MNDLTDNCNDDNDKLDEHQLPIEDIVTAIEGQDPQPFLDAIADLLK